MQKTIKKFELDPRTVKVKEMLNKDFLELEIKAISTANPNRNGSAFSKEALTKAIPTFYNKPILGSFSVSQDDFRAHEGDLSYDEEYEQLYYDYTDEASETPLGLIRGDDKVEIVHDKRDGLDWLKFTCAIWVKYNYKQVKKLLKSRDGHKKISVEVEVLDSTFDENGIEHINDFVFDGVTILGDKYETGIADANLTILEMVENALFQKQQKCLAFAYDSLDKNASPLPQEVANEISSENFSEEENNLENEEVPQILMDEEQEKGGKTTMELSLESKKEILLGIFEEKFSKEGVCPWIVDIDSTFVYTMEYPTAFYRYPYSFVTLNEKTEGFVDFEAKERVIKTWVSFNKEQEDLEFGHDEEKKEKCIECVIHDLIIDEHKAIQGYKHAEKHFSEEFPLVAKIFHEIGEEEMIHVGELEQALQMVSDETEDHLEEGKQEAKDIIIEELIEQQEEEQEEPKVIFPSIFEGEESGIETQESIDSSEETSACETYDDDPNDKDDINDKDDDPDDINDKDDIDDKDDPDDKDDDPDDRDDKDDIDDKHEPDDINDKDDDFNCEEKFSTSLIPNSEPTTIDIEGRAMEEIIKEATDSINPPDIITDVERVGDANAEVASIIKDVEEVIIEGAKIEPLEEIKKPATTIEQPNDKEKERPQYFVSTVEVNGVSIDINTLLEKYTELEGKFNDMNNSIKAQQTSVLASFGADFVNSDRVVDEETKKDFISQIKEKCEAFELTSEEEVTKFAKGLMAMYYYEHQAVHEEKETSEEFSLDINKPTHVNNNASKLKDVINKLNNLN